MQGAWLFVGGVGMVVGMDALKKELHVRTRILSIYNKRPQEFGSKREYDDYLEEREDVIFQLSQEKDTGAVEAKIAEYKRENSLSINENRARAIEQSRESLGGAGVLPQGVLGALDVDNGRDKEGGSYAPRVAQIPGHLAMGFGNAQPGPVGKVELNGEGGFKGRGKQPKNAQEWARMASASGWSRDLFVSCAMSRAFGTVGSRGGRMDERMDKKRKRSVDAG